MVLTEADAEIYRRHAGELTRFATGLVGPSDAPDVVIEAAVSAFRSPQWPKVEDRRAYLYRCVLNTARTRHRSDTARRRREQRAAAPERVAHDPPDVDVLAALGSLSVRQRAAIVLTYWEDLTVTDVAARLKVSEGSVRRHLARARARLREVLR